MRANRSRGMRVLALLFAGLVASMPVFPTPLSTTTGPQILYGGGSNCAAAKRNAAPIAGALGYATVQTVCFRANVSTLAGESAPRPASIPGLVAYGANLRRPSGEPAVSYATFLVPAGTPYVSANGKIVAQIKLDALVLALQVDNVLQTAFALEDAGISRRDIISDPIAGAPLLVRVRPLTPAQALKIAGVAQVQWGIGFVKDCDAAIAASGALAVRQARRHAEVIAQAAHTGLGKLLGIVDEGADVPDAICGLGAGATLHQLALAILNAPQDSKPALATVQFYATIVRSVSGGWRLNRPPNAPAPVNRIWERAYPGRWWAERPHPTFIADGAQAQGVR